jgi:hypothetical protein
MAIAYNNHKRCGSSSLWGHVLLTDSAMVAGMNCIVNCLLIASLPNSIFRSIINSDRMMEVLCSAYTNPLRSYSNAPYVCMYVCMFVCLFVVDLRGQKTDEVVR